MEFPFQWKIAEYGYLLQELDGVEWLAYKPSTTWTLYQPLKQHTGLYQDFIALDDTDAMLAFANKYGLLGIPGGRPLHGEPGPGLSAERLDDWRSKIFDLGSAVKAWTAIQDNDRAYLKRVIKWKQKPRTAVNYKDSRTFADGHWNKTAVRLKDTHPDGSALKYGDLIWPAYRYIQDRINAALKDSAAPRMLWDEYNELKLYLVPGNLLGAMWLQFADAVSYHLEYRHCDWCSKPFEVSRSTRSDRKYCSHSCRVSASRKRTREARRK